MIAVRSKESFHAEIHRDNSRNTINGPSTRKRLCSECSRNSHDFDLVPEFFRDRETPKKLVYLSEDEPSLMQDPSRSRFDLFDEKHLNVIVETRESERSVTEKQGRNNRIKIDFQPGTPSKVLGLHQKLGQLSSTTAKAKAETIFGKKGNEKKIPEP